MVIDHLNCLLELIPGPLVIFLVLAHLVKQLLQDLTLGDVERLVLIRIAAKAATLLALLSLLTFLGRHLYFASTVTITGKDEMSFLLL